MKNTKLAQKIADKKLCIIGKHVDAESGCINCTVESCERNAAYCGALEMANQKDEAFKIFLQEHVSIPYEGGYGEDGSPFVDDYIEWIEKQHAIGLELFEKFKASES